MRGFALPRCEAAYATSSGNLDCIYRRGHQGPHVNDWKEQPIAWWARTTCPTCGGKGYLNENEPEAKA